MAETCPNRDIFFVLETPKAKIILETSFTNYLYFELQVFTVHFKSTCVYIIIKTDIFSDECCTCSQNPVNW